MEGPKRVKGITIELKLLITEKDLEKIKKLKNPNKSKVYKQYNNLLFNCLKTLEIPHDNKVEVFNSIEDLEMFNED